MIFSSQIFVESLIESGRIEYMLFPFSALLYSLIVTVMFITKKKTLTIENRIYKVLLYIIDLQLLVNCLNFAIADPLWSRITKTFYNVLFVLWGCYMTLFFAIVASSKNQGYVDFDENPEKKYFKDLMIFTNLIAVILAVLVVILPMSKDNLGIYMTSTGVSPTFCYLIFIVLVIGWFALFIKSKSKEVKKKFIPIGVCIGVGIIGVVAQIILSELYITNNITAICTNLIFFTIGNPDTALMKDLVAVRENAERANKSKSEFLSSMSHEIRTPLNAIVGFSESLYEEPMTSEQKGDVNIITSSAINLLEIVNGILDISKMDADKLTLVEREYVLNKAINDIGATAGRYMGEKKLNLIINVDPKLPQILFGDVVKLSNIITNLLTNAIKYTSEGNIELNVTGFIKDDKCRLIVYVEDDGMGIREQNLNDLFISYQKTGLDKEEGLQGSGLGVAVTKRLVNLMGGDIVVRSKEGLGTVFMFALEQGINARTSNEVEDVALEEMVIYDCSGKKILVVDDNGVNLKVAKRLLVNYKMEVDLENSGQDCIDKIKLGEHYDLILMDDFMPNLSGAQTLSELKKINDFNIPVIALTANNESGSKEKYMNLGFDGYLAKPIAKEELNKLIKQYLV